jgi:selenocysteine lyase/cysteine desulfurase
VDPGRIKTLIGRLFHVGYTVEGTGKLMRRHGAAVRQALHLGTDAIGERTAMLGRRLRGQLDELPGVSTYDLGEVRCAIVTACIEGVPAADVAAALGRTGVNVSTTAAEHNPSTRRTARYTRWCGSPRTTTTPRKSSTARLGS